mgnify:CR=1 FL=1
MFVTFLTSILYLARGEQRKYDIVAAASVEIGVIFGFMVLLSGTLVSSASGPPWICDRGNPGMASGGMGDVLAGMLAAVSPLPQN